jgi:hypothetical protein
VHGGAHAEAARDIAQHIDALEALHRLIERCLHAPGVEEIGRNE